MDSKQPIELCEITMDNFYECIDMSVAEHQQGFVASNMYSLAEAKADGVSIPLAIYSSGVMVGFIMYNFDSESGTGYIDRLMVAAEHQRRGYGRAAMLEVISRLRNTPGCLRIRTSFDPPNTVADALYQGLGFRRTGEVDGGEIVVVLELPERV
ncbi:MAG: GNAT family N-acetyltransferase [Proteobacteria bacterium]|nr:GNAT family N-acetyltransferase [Pseudomonadota bacterium]